MIGQTRTVTGFENATRRRSGLWLPAGVRASSERPTAIDLFCGCGGFSLGFLQAGFEVLLGVDTDVAACTTYWFNLCGTHSRWISDEKALKKRDRLLKRETFDGWITNREEPPVRAVVCGDVRDWTGAALLALVGREVGDVDCVMGGPPCQGFSYGGKRDVHDPRNSLVWEFARLVHEIKPKTFVMENVPGMVNMTTPSGQNVLSLLMQAFESEGYVAVSQRMEEALKKAGKDIAVVGTKAMRRKALEESKVQLAGEDVQLSLF